LLLRVPLYIPPVPCIEASFDPIIDFLPNPRDSVRAYADAFWEAALRLKATQMVLAVRDALNDLACEDKFG
jgi:hypothetical protein